MNSVVSSPKRETILEIRKAFHSYLELNQTGFRNSPASVITYNLFMEIGLQINPSPAPPDSYREE